MSAYGNMDEALAGLAYGCENEVVSRLAANKVDFGDLVFVNPGDPDYLSDGVLDEGTLTFSADFVTSNSIVLTINSVAQSAVVFATDHATTFAAVVAKMAAAGLTVIASDATARTIRVRTVGVALTVSVAVTGGASQATGTFAAATLQLFGVAIRTDKIPGYYAANDAVNIMREGLVWVPVSSAVAANATAYYTSGKVLTDVSSGNTATTYKFRKGTTGAGLALLEVIK